MKKKMNNCCTQEERNHVFDKDKRYDYTLSYDNWCVEFLHFLGWFGGLLLLFVAIFVIGAFLALIHCQRGINAFIYF